MQTFILYFSFLLMPSVASYQEQKLEEKQDLKERVKEHQPYVTQIRGLDFKHEVDTGIYTKDELREFLIKELNKDFGREEAEKWEKAYVHFGLIPKDLDLYDAVITLYRDAIAGFYHQETKELRLVQMSAEDEAQNDMLKQMLGVGMEEITLVHELCHAAQDQHHDLVTLPLDNEYNDDMLYAIKGVVEGDASVVGWKFALKEKFNATINMINAPYKAGMLPGEAATMPRYLRVTMTFPYGHGTEFVLKVIGDDPKTADKLFDKFPTSTEQILHPEKYTGENPDWPTEIKFKDILQTLDSDGEILVDNVHGEFGLSVMLQEINAAKSRASKKAAAGWDGDRYFVIEEDGAVFSVWLSTWDNEEEAQEFFQTYQAGLLKKYEKPEQATDEKTRHLWDVDDRQVLMERRGVDVLVLDNVTPSVIEKADDLFSSAKKSELKTVVRKEKIENKDGEKSSYGF